MTEFLLNERSTEELRVDAEKGDAKKQSIIAFGHESQWIRDESRRFPSENLAEAIRFFRMAANQGFAPAQFHLGWLYGYQCMEDCVEAVRWFRLAADQGYGPAQLNLGVMYDNGEGVAQDYAEAARWYRKAADQGYQEAQFYLGLLYEYAQDGFQDYVQAYYWLALATYENERCALKVPLFRKESYPAARDSLAAKMNSAQIAEAQLKLGDEYKSRVCLMCSLSDSLGSISSDGSDRPCPHHPASRNEEYAREAAAWYRKAAELGNVDGQLKIAVAHREGTGVPKDFVEAVRWYRKAAEQGDATAQFDLGWMYDNGEGVLQDYAEAAGWYYKAAEQRLARAQFKLGALYHNGTGVAQNLAEAARWYREAAEQGDAEAQYWLGDLYSLNLDQAEAARWFRMAAHQGEARAQFRLGLRYYYGEDAIHTKRSAVAKDYIQAHLWLSLAASQANSPEQARYVAERDRVAAKMNSAQIAEAQRLAREWKPMNAK
jgi:TPR repeat protein